MKNLLSKIPANACVPCEADKRDWKCYPCRPATMCYHHHREWVMEKSDWD